MKFCSTALIAVLAYIALSHAIPIKWPWQRRAPPVMTLPPPPRLFLYKDPRHPGSCDRFAETVSDMTEMISSLTKMMTNPVARETVGVILTLGTRAFWICESR